MSMVPEFVKFPKIARLSRQCVITEKIDGTNASIYVPEDSSEPLVAGSRNRWITSEADNHGFARWVKDNEEELRGLGPGVHVGEWWGSGIQRGYGLIKGEKRFSLFNTNRWGPVRDTEKYPEDRPACCNVVPVLAVGLFNSEVAENQLDFLRREGSFAAPGFMHPEGIVIWHEAARTFFKKTIEGDEAPKGISA